MKKAPFGALFLAVMVAAAAPAPAPPAEPPAVADLLHAGRFDEADAVLAAAAREADGPRVAFQQAFVTYWRLLYDPKNESLLSELEARLDHAVEVAAGPSTGGGERADALTLWPGLARMLRAQLYANRHKPFKAAFEAKRAKRLLETAARGQAEPDAFFGLGTYHYYASQVPALVKGLRFLLALPGGNRDKGLEELETAATRSLHFGLEARIVLATIYSGKHERDYARALREIELALADRPRSIAALDAASRIDLSVFRPERAAERLDTALALARPDIDPAVLARLRLQRALAEMASFRPDRALRELRPLLGDDRASARASLGGAFEQLLDSAVRLNGLPEWLDGSAGRSDLPSVGAGDELARRALHLALPALESERAGKGADAAETLLSLGRDAPSDPALALLAGRALLREGRAPEALAWLERAAAGRLPDPWIGPCLLMAGQAADLTGDRDRALKRYREALEAPSFEGRGAAYLYRERPYRS